MGLVCCGSNRRRELNMRNKSVSVVIPTYNGVRFIRETLESVFAQTKPASEIVVVDDASTDGTIEVVRDLARIAPVPLRLIALETNTGTPAEPTNVAVQSATSEYIAILDQDDICLPDRLKKQVPYLDLHPECVAVGGAAMFSDPKARPLYVPDFCLNHDAIDAALLMKPGALGLPMLHPTLLVRREAMLRIGGYRTDFRASYDRDLMLRLAEVGRLANIESVVLCYRLHATSFSHQRWREHQRFSVRAVREAYERREMTPPDELQSTITSREGVCDSANWASMAVRGGNYRTARIHALHSLLQQPWCTRSYRLVARAFLGRIGERCASWRRRLLTPPPAGRRVQSP